ncbi:hypothetical protein ACB092_12G019000 [Castanea dentata]
MLPYRPESSPLLDSLPEWSVPHISRFGDGMVFVYTGYAPGAPELEGCWKKGAPSQDFIAHIYRTVGNVPSTIAFESEIPEWFELQNKGAEINIKVPSHLCNELAGIATCAVICCCQPVDIVQLDYYFTCNGQIITSNFTIDSTPPDLSDQLFLAHLPIGTSNWKRYVVNGFAKFGIRYRAQGSGMEVKECGIHLVYKKDSESFRENHNRITAERKKKAIEESRAERIERRKKQREKDIDEIKQLMAESQRSNNSIILYEGSDDCDGAGPSGEGSSNDVTRSRLKGSQNWPIRTLCLRDQFRTTN